MSSEASVNKAGPHRRKLILAVAVLMVLILGVVLWFVLAGGPRDTLGNAEPGANVEDTRDDGSSDTSASDDGGSDKGAGSDGAVTPSAAPSAPAGSSADPAAVPAPAPTNVSGDPGALPPAAGPVATTAPSTKGALPPQRTKADTTGCSYVVQQLDAAREAARSGGADAARGLLARMEDLQGDPAAAEVSQEFDSIRRLWSTAVSEADTGGNGQDRIAEADKVIASTLKELKCS